MTEKYPWGPTSRPEVVFPFTRTIGGKIYHQSLINPDLVRNTSETRARAAVMQLRKEGWLARVVRFTTRFGYIYLAYERRSRGQLRNMTKDYGSQHVKAAGIVNRPPQRGRRARRKM